MALHDASAEVDEHAATLAAIEGRDQERVRRLVGEALAIYDKLL